jgi:hypothetical protein
MAETVLTHKYQKITLSGTSEHTLNFDNMLKNKTEGSNPLNGVALIELKSGASVQISPNATIDSVAGTVTTAFPKVMVDIRNGHPIRVKGGAGSEVLDVSILSADE